LARWHPRLRVADVRTIFDLNLRRFGPARWIVHLVPGFRTKMGSSIVELEVVPPG